MTSLLATVNVTFAGDWVFELTEFGEPVTAPVTLHVDTGPTHAESCDVKYKFEITAGNNLVYLVVTADVHGNPTSHLEGEFELNVIGDSTEAGPHTFTVTQTSTGSLVGSTQYGFNVLPAAPDTASSTHNVANGTELVSAKDQVLELRVFPKDAFNNVVTVATGYFVSIDGETHNLSAPDFNYTHRIKAGYEGEIELEFTLNDVDIKNSPVTIKVEPLSTGTGLSRGVIGASVAALFSLFLVGSFFLFLYKKKVQLNTLQLQLSHDEAQQRMQQERNMIREENSNLQGENLNLQESLRKKKHSEEELQVMMKAMGDLTKERENELRGVLIKGDAQ